MQKRAGDAFELVAVADVDAHRADGDAGVAVDAVADVEALGLRLLLVPRARLAAPVIVGDEERILVEHGALDARPRAHIGADLLAHEAGEDDRSSR